MANLFKPLSTFSGGYFPSELVAKLRLAALCERKPVTKFLKKLIEQYIAEEHNQQEQLIICIANKLKEHWLRKQESADKQSFKEFKIGAKKDLQKRKISTTYIQLILNTLETSIQNKDKK